MGTIFREGWAKYGDVGDALVSVGSLPLRDIIQANGWSVISTVTGATADFVTGPTPGSVGLRATSLATGASVVMASRGLGSNNVNFALGFYFKIEALPSADRVVIAFEDGTTSQCCLTISSTGVLSVRSAGVAGSVLGTGPTLSTGVWYFIECSGVINNTTGSFDLDVNGVSEVSVTSVNTRGGTANAYINNFSFWRGGSSGTPVIGPLYVRDDTTRLGEVTVETLFISADDAVQFAFGAAVMGEALRTDSSTNAPGANQLALRKYTCPISGTLDSVTILPQASNAGAKFKSVIYADNGSGSAPTGAPIDTGSEVVGATSGTLLVLPCTTPPSLTGGTIYWIGYITDTSVALALTDTNTQGYKAANTYASGAPSSPTMTSAQSSWVIFGKLSSVAVNWASVVNAPPLGDLSYVYSASVNDEDLFDIDSLTSVPLTIYDATVYAYMRKTDASARTMDLRAKSGATTSSGDSAGQAQSVSYAWYGSVFTTDPNTGAAWTSGGVNAMKIGYMIAS